MSNLGCVNTVPTGDLAPDCRHYRGDRPCLHNRLCRGCTHYTPYQARICIIKLGALGDVIRTLCLLPELRRQYPEAHITWVSLPNGCRMIGAHTMLDRVLPFDALTAMTLTQERFDLVISLDKEPQPCALAMALRATHKLGIGLSDHGTPVPLNPEAAPYFHLGLSDELKFRQNRRSYPHLVYEALGWSYRGQRYELPLSGAQRHTAQMLLRRAGWRDDRATLGINVGAGKAFANKMWPATRILDVIRVLVKRRPGVQVVLLGGPGERPIIDELLAATRETDLAPTLIDPGADHDEPTFAGLIDACDVLFCGDTMAMHVAVARGTGVVAVFGPTCEQEIDLFGRGEKLVARVPCGPCYKRVCDRADVCVNAVDTVDAVDALEGVLDAARSRRIHPGNPRNPRNPRHIPLRKAG